MATSNQAAWQALQSHLMAMGYAPNVIIGEPRTPPESGMVAIISVDGNVDEATLTSPREIHRVWLRMYRNWLEEPADETEFVLDQFRADIEEDVFGDFELGGNVAYVLPDEFAWTYEENTVGDTLYRIVNVHVAYRIDDRATFTA